MCFSPEASFTVGAALLPAGVYCTQAAVRKDARFVPLRWFPWPLAFSRSPKASYGAG